MTRVTLIGLLVLAALLRIYLAHAGGQYYVQDETHHFRPAALAASALHRAGLAGWSEASAALLSQSIQCGYRLWSMLAAVLVFVLFGNHQISLPWIMAALLGMASIGVAVATGQLARQLGAETNEARWATALALGSVAVLQWSRHFVPYDCGLWLCLIALRVAFREPSAGSAVGVGLLACGGFLTYLGTFAVAAVAMATTIGRALLRRRWALLPIAPAAAGLLLFAVGRLPWAYAPQGLVVQLGGTFRTARLESWGSSYSEGWWVPWAYLWHVEHVVLLCWLGLVAFGLHGKSQRARIGGGIAAGLYLLLVLHSTVLERAVVVGRSVRLLVPFLCLAAAGGLVRLPGRARALVGIALSAAFVMNASPLVQQRYPADLNREWVRRYGPLAYAGELEGMDDIDTPSSRYVGVNIAPGMSPWPATQRHPLARAGRVLETFPHPLAWKGLQYEGYPERARDAVRAAPLPMSLLEVP